MKTVYFILNRTLLSGLFLSLMFVMNVSGQDIPDEPAPDCDHYGTVMLADDADCGYLIMLDEGYPIKFLEEIHYSFFYEGSRVSVGFNVLDSLYDSCMDALLVSLTCIEPVDTLVDCKADFDAYSSDILIAGYPYDFHDVSYGEIVERRWSVNGEDIGNDPYISYTFPEEGVYTVCLAIETSEGCYDEVCKEIAVGETEPCQARFKYFPLEFILANSDESKVKSSPYDSVDTDTSLPDTNIIDPMGMAYQFIDASSSYAVEWTWEINEEIFTGTPDLIYVFTEPGVYEVCLTILTKDSCSSTHCEMVYVDSIMDCQAYFDYYSPLDDSAYYEDYPGSRFLQFIDRSMGYITEWHWDFGDGNTSNEQNPVHEFAEHGVFEVCLKVAGPTGCEDMYCQTVYFDTLHSDCKASFEYCTYSTPDNDSMFVNNHIIGFKNTSTPADAWVQWEFGDGYYSNEKNPVHVYEAPGYYTVCLQVYGLFGCFDSYCETIVVGMDSCSVSFTHDMIAPDCSGFDIAHLFTPMVDEEAGSYYWDFGDGNYSYDAQAAHVYESTGDYEVCLEVFYMSGCYARYCMSIFNSSDTNDSVYYEKCYVTGLAKKKNNLSTIENLNTYPVPASDMLNIEFKSDVSGQLSLQLFNSYGQLIHEVDEGISQGTNKLNISLEDVMPGTYFYQLKTPDGMHRQKFSVIKY